MRWRKSSPSDFDREKIAAANFVAPLARLDDRKIAFALRDAVRLVILVLFPRGSPICSFPARGLTFSRRGRELLFPKKGSSRLFPRAKTAPPALFARK